MVTEFEVLNQEIAKAQLRSTRELIKEVRELNSNMKNLSIILRGREIKAGL